MNTTKIEVMKKIIEDRIAELQKLLSEARSSEEYRMREYDIVGYHARINELYILLEKL